MLVALRDRKGAAMVTKKRERLVLLTTALMFGLFAASASFAQNCCTHQGQSVQCPAGLPPESGSVEFVPGGTEWVTPSGAKVFVPQTSFAACTSPPPSSSTPSTTPAPPTSPAKPPSPAPPATTTPPRTTTPSPTAPTQQPTTTVPLGTTTPRWPTPPPVDSGDGTEFRARPLNEPDSTVVPIPGKPSDDAKATEEQIQRLRQLREQQPPQERTPSTPDQPPPTVSPPDELVLHGRPHDALCPGKGCTSDLKEDPAISCLRRTHATISDGHGVPHTATLDTQLGLALGIDFAGVGQGPANEAAGTPAYDCGGVFYGPGGKPKKVPPFPPSTARTDADVVSWGASVAAFYQTAYTDAKQGRKLSAGKALLCTNWAETYFSTNPDPSLLQAMTALQQMGAEQMIGQDNVWLTNIVKAGATRGCSTPAPLARRVTTGWWVPLEDAKAFDRLFRDCAEPDVNHVGGCPHSFDTPGGPGNHVNDRYLFDAQNSTNTSQAAAFFGD